ncbi:DUF2815 family protein [Tissierella praeacuta]|uniref:DUF2815 family protein n=1 Tax=Tissierella praeacuta TaxID=43131 RepID=UPI002898AF4B|nr:DUF2815 family protein [Tissierella praeacuta]
MKAIMKNETKVITGKVRLSYANIFEPKSINGSEPKYSVSLIIPKDDKQQIKVIEEAIKNAIERDKTKLSNKAGKVPANLKTPLRDGDEDRPDDEVYEGCYFINANSTKAPAVVSTEKDRTTGKAIPLGEDEVYSGCYARVSINFYGFNTNGNVGIACGLGNIQKVEDGERLGGGSSAEEDFEFEEVDVDDDFLN